MGAGASNAKAGDANSKAAAPKILTNDTPTADKGKGSQDTAHSHIHGGYDSDTERDINALYVDGTVIVSGGKDGKVKLWNAADMKMINAFDIKQVSSSLQDSLGRPLVFAPGKSPNIKSVCRNRGKILVGTASCEILEINETEGFARLFNQGHSSGEVWGLATHPKKDIFATVSDDKTVRVWDVAKRSLIAMRQLANSGRSVSYSPDGSKLAIGMIDGSFSVIEAGNGSLKDLFFSNLRKEQIGELKFSPCGKFLAVGSYDNFIDLYDVERDFKLIGTLKGHNSFITHLDWSKDSKYIQSNCGAYELLFWDVRTHEQHPRAHELRDVEWASWTCTMGWPVQGIWQRNAKGTDINAVDKSHLSDCLATGDDFGMVNLFKYPVPKPGMLYKRYPAHSSHVTNVRFMFNDRHLISTGGADKTVMQWRHLDESQTGLYSDTKEIQEELEVTYEKNRTMKERTKPATQPIIHHRHVDEEPKENGKVTNTSALPNINKASSKDAGAGAGVGAEHPRRKQFQSHLPDPSLKSETAPRSAIPSGWFTSTPPWLGAVFPPTQPEKHPLDIDGELPNAKLELEFVHGYRGHDSRDNLFYLSNGEIVYSTAGVGVVYNPQTHTQRFFMDHTDDIVSLTLHPDGRTVATGQVGKDPAIFVWDAISMKRLAVLSGAHQRAVTSLGFSSDGSKLPSWCGRKYK